MVKSMKKILCIALAALLAVPFAGCSEGAKKTQSEAEQQTLKVGMECAYAPFNWTQTDDSNGAVAIDDANGTYAGGYDIQISKKIAEGLGMKLEIVKTEWDGLIPALTSGKIDMIVAGMSPTDERKQSIDFTSDYYTSDLVVVVKKSGAFASASSLADFSGAKLTAQLNTFHYTVLDQVPGVNKQTAMSDFPTMIVALQSGKIDGYISELPGAKAAVYANPDLSYVEFAEGSGFSYDNNDVSVAVGLKKGSGLTDKINGVLATISEDERQQIMDTAISQQPLTEG